MDHTSAEAESMFLKASGGLKLSVPLRTGPQRQRVDAFGQAEVATRDAHAAAVITDHDVSPRFDISMDHRRVLRMANGNACVGTCLMMATASSTGMNFSRYDRQY